MQFRQILGIATGVILLWGAPMRADETNLLSNGGFEERSCNAVFGCSFEDWSGQGSGAAASTDHIEGEVALLMNPTTAAVLDQAVSITDAYYVDGTSFKIKINYKVVSMPDGGSLALDCYWEPAGGGNADVMRQHDAAVLQQSLESASEWTVKEVETTKPNKSAYLRIRVKVPKSAKVLFDDFRVIKGDEPAADEPFINVSPIQLKSVSVTIGNSAQFETVHVEHGNVAGPTTFELSGYHPEMFSLSASSLAADQSAIDLIITYAPTSAGTHEALLNIDNLQHTSLFQSIKLTGTCTDPSQQPSLSVSPSVLPVFEAVAGQEQSRSFSVTSVNCTDYVYLRVDHQEGAAFTIDGSMLAKNSTSTVNVRFAPKAAGHFLSTVTVYTEGATSVVLQLEGNASEAEPQTRDWATDFVWNMSQPLAEMNEHFDGAEHNKTLLVSGWQNVAAENQRPWWGFDASRSSAVDGDGQFAKATAYKSDQAGSGDWEMWLVTPALDYKNAVRQVFSFRIMGQYMLQDENPTALEVYFIDATHPGDIFFQDLSAEMALPKTGDENDTWFTFDVDLTGQSLIPDVFFMAFRYVGPSGKDGVVTYYIDDVSWGVAKTGFEEVQSDKVQSTKVIKNGVLVIKRDGKEYNAQGQLMK